MLRIHLTADDLTRIRVAAGPDPMWEILLSAHLLNRAAGTVAFGRWRERTLADPPPGLGMLLHLAPPWGYSPDFLTPAAVAGDVDGGVEAVLCTPRTRLRRDLELLGAWRRPRAWTRSLAEGDPPALRRLGAVMHEYHARALAPYWGRIRAGVDADRAARARTLLAGGTDRLLAGLHPSIRWRPPVLEVALPPERDIHLDGRGLLVLPSFFCWRDPITLHDPGLPPVLVYPIAHELGWADPVGDGRGARSLAALLGRTRAAALRALSADASTSELARRLTISVASASEHATVLRDAGLISSRRHRNAVHHTLTPLGRDLLEASAAGSRGPGGVPELILA